MIASERLSDCGVCAALRTPISVRKRQAGDRPYDVILANIVRAGTVHAIAKPAHLHVGVGADDLIGGYAKFAFVALVFH